METRRIEHLARNELGNIDLRQSLARLALSMLPPLVGVRIRTRILRAAGATIGRGTTFGGTLHIQGGRAAVTRLTIGGDCWINGPCTFDASGPIDIGDWVAIGQHVLILTNTHRLAGPKNRAGKVQTFPVRIGDGVWIGARSTVLPGVTIGSGAVVAAGAVVNRDVAPNTMVGGVPARVIRVLDDD